jgi:hypothetical protein
MYFESALAGLRVSKATPAGWKDGLPRPQEKAANSSLQSPPLVPPLFPLAASARLDRPLSEKVGPGFSSESGLNS